MADVSWFKNEFEVIKEFSCEVAPLIASVEAFDEKIVLLNKEKEEIKTDEEFVVEIRSQILEQAISTLEDKNKVILEKVRALKEEYMAEELLDTLETVSVIDEGEKIADDVCNLLKKINTLSIKHGFKLLG